MIIIVSLLCHRGTIMLTEYLNTLNLNIGESHRGDCPICNHSNTFSVTNSGTHLLYNCYHAMVLIATE